MATVSKPPGRDQLRDNVVISTYVAGGAGVVGATLGAAYATAKGRPLVLWSMFTGFQFSLLGGTFWLTRSTLQAFASKDRPVSRRDDMVNSTLAGSTSGVVAGALRSSRNILPAVLVMGTIGLGGQLAAFSLSARGLAPQQKRPLLDRLADSRWWPLKVLSDEDYEKELNEKIIGLEAEMSLIDDKIAHLKQQGAKPGDSR